MAMTSLSANLPDPRVTALETARAMYPTASVADQIAVAEYLLRPMAAPVGPAQWAPPVQVTCEVPGAPRNRRMSAGGFVSSGSTPPYVAIDSGSGEYIVGAGGGAGHGSLTYLTTFRTDAANHEWPDDDGTAGVPAKVG